MLPIRSTAALAAAAALALCASASPATAADVKSRLQENWRAEIVNVPAPASGCFQAEFPSKIWARTACVKAPLTPYIPRRILNAAGGRTVGNGHDFAAVAHGPITSATGSFPVVSGVVTETGGLGANDYSLQLNSNFFTSSVCRGSSTPANCLGWEQFVYASGYTASFIQYWLINYGNTCPTTPYNDWNQFQGSCYRNSRGVAVPLQPATQLAQIKIKGTANSQNDTFVTTIGTKAYSTGGNDNVVALATGWAANEFNVVGDGGGSGATFNTGTSITVQIKQTDGTTLAPTCTADSGTTGETNNLNLGICAARGGTVPLIRFTQHN
jgi:hypothetical protein